MTNTNRLKDVSRFLDSFNRLSKVFASVDNFPGEISLSKLEILTIGAIGKEEELIMTKLASKLDVRLSTATGVVDRLVEKNLVQRYRNGGDRRVVRLKLTKNGRDIAARYQQQMEAVFIKMLGLLTDAERRSLVSIFEKLAREIEG